MDIFPVAWHARDVDDQYTITVFGKTPGAALVAVHIHFYPFFYVHVPQGWSPSQMKLFVAESAAKYNALPHLSRAVSRVSMWGFTNNESIKLVQLAFATLKSAKAAARKLTFKTYESTIDPLLRFFHLQHIAPAQWITIPEGCPSTPEGSRMTRSGMELTTLFNNVGPSERTSLPPLVIASWDIECISATKQFPLAHKEHDKIIQIATTFQRYGEPRPYRQVVTCLRDTDAVEGVDILSFDDEADVINRWIELLDEESADILIGYNTDQVHMIMESMI